MNPRTLTLENFGPFVGKNFIDFTRLEDIFLITGETGAGKTTIFDALCFALYGEATGSRNGHSTTLRSDHASAGEVCSVTFEFSAGEREYRIYRSPKYERKKKRGEGTKEVPEKLELDEIKGGFAHPYNAKKEEIQGAIKKIIGLDAENFLKFILLPQGKFAEFLNLNSNQRRETLGKIFPVKIAAKIADYAAKEEMKARNLCEEALRQKDDLEKTIHLENFSEQVVQAEKEINELKTNTEMLIRHAEKLRKLCDLQNQELEISRQLNKLRAEYAANERNKKLIDDYRYQLERCAEAEPLIDKLKQTDSSRLAVQQAKKELDQAQQRREQMERYFSKKEEEAKQCGGFKNRIKTLTETALSLQKLIDYEKELHTIQREENELSSTVQELGYEVKEKESCIQKAHNLIDAYSDLDSTYETVQDARGQLENFYSAFSVYQTVCLREQDCLSRISLEEQEAASLNAQMHELQQEVQVLEQEEQTVWINHLRELLEPGKPCPVCGSRHHRYNEPELESIDKDSNSTLKSRLQAMEKAEKRHAECTGTLKALTRELDHIQQEKTQSHQMLLQAKPLWWQEEIKEQNITRARAEKKAQYNELLKQKERVHNARRDIDRVSSTLNEVKDRYIKSTTRRDLCIERQKQLTQTIQEIRKQYETVIDKQQRAADALAALEREIGELEKEIQKRENEYNRVDKELDRAKTQEEYSRKWYEKCDCDYQTAASELDAALVGTIFSDGDALKSAVLEVKQKEALSKQIRNWEETNTKLATQIESLESSLTSCRNSLYDYGWVAGQTLADTYTQQKQLGDTQKEVQERYEQAIIKRNTLYQTKEQYDEAFARWEKYEKERVRLSALSDTLNGRNAKRLKFETWLLGSYMEEVVYYARPRLEKMSDYRYSLQLGDSFGRGQSGLDLAVLDSYTGKVRPCGTLSGGETFLASISLALGLADSLQNRSGGIHLDAVFIDEGFGSLDEESLNKATQVLEELKEHRMVGLISHVTEMRSRIPSHIEVKKTAAGSQLIIN